MDRRTFFKMAGAGAGALLIVPSIVTMQLDEPKKIVPKDKPNLIPGFLYQGNTQVAAVANCGIDMYWPTDTVFGRDGWAHSYRSGKMETTIHGDMLPLLEDYMYRTALDEEYRILLNMPDGQMYLDAEGYLSRIGLDSSMDSDMVYDFVFQVNGAATLNYSATF